MKKTIASIIFLGLLVTLYINCKSHGNPLKDEVSGVVDTSFTINIKPFPPQDLDSNATPKQLVQFAWEEFLALNWKSSFDKNGLRDSPDTLWSYNNDTLPYPALNVWETYAHRSELRPWNDTMLPFDAPPHYSIGTKPVAIENASFKLFDNLDESNEIGSCNMFARTNLYGTKHQVLYQAKVNRDEYEYIRTNYKDKASLLKATSNTAANIKSYAAYYGGAKNTCNCPKDSNVVCLPCGGAPRNDGSGKTYTGTMEIKSAWRELTKEDDPTKFFTRKVIYYTKGATENSIQYHNKIYALIGLHIIHKTVNYPDFVFATFEHVDVEKDSMGYRLLNSSGKAQGNLERPYRDPIVAITAASTNYVHSKLPKTSIWQNYRLVGVQATPTNDTSAFSFFLANYVVESDSALNHFRGNSIGSPHNDSANILYKGKFLSMGGCQGCHGVAQTQLGTDFSFLLDTVGKPVKIPDSIGLDNTIKLRQYIKAFALAQKKGFKYQLSK